MRKRKATYAKRRAARRPGQATHCTGNRCGICFSCEEDDRWSRIYRAKFEDPDYYGFRQVRASTPLHNLIGPYDPAL